MAIEHSGEPLGNGIRARIEATTGRGQRTRTPSLAAIAGAEGAYLYTADGRRLADFAAGVLVANLGHNHAAFERKYAEYAKGLPRSSYNMTTEIEALAAERLLASMQSPKAERVLWAASGSEGIQKALWAALHRDPNRTIILATKKGFHGKKGLAGDVSGESSPNPNVRFVPFPTDHTEPESVYRDALAALAAEFPGRIACLVTEPYLGAAGSFHPPHWYMRLLEEFCEEQDAAFIFDEVQSCHGRTGSMFAYQSYHVTPDLVVMGKGLGNGEPVAAVAGRKDLIDSLDYGEASDTFSGNPRACAAVCAVLDVFAEDRIVEQVREKAPYLRSSLESLSEAFPFIEGVRGEGFVYGVEMSSKAVAEACVLEAYRGTGLDGVHFLGPLAGKVLRVSPPLTMTRGEMDQAFGILHEAWRRVAAELQPA